MNRWVVYKDYAEFGGPIIVIAVCKSVDETESYCSLHENSKVVSEDEFEIIKIMHA